MFFKQLNNLWIISPKIYSEFSSQCLFWASILWPCLWILPSEYNMGEITLFFMDCFNDMERNFWKTSSPQIQRNHSCASQLPIHVELARAHLHTIQFHLSTIHPLSVLKINLVLSSRAKRCHRDVIVF